MGCKTVRSRRNLYPSRIGCLSTSNTVFDYKGTYMKFPVQTKPRIIVLKSLVWKQLRVWSKSLGWDGWEWRWDGSSIFDLLVKGWVIQFSALWHRDGPTCLRTGIDIRMTQSTTEVTPSSSKRRTTFSNRSWKSTLGRRIIKMAISCIVKPLWKLRSLTEWARSPRAKCSKYCANTFDMLVVKDNCETLKVEFF